jgi:hypothetical protein
MTGLCTVRTKMVADKEEGKKGIPACEEYICTYSFLDGVSL